MLNPRELSEAERQALWVSVQLEFPDDEMMREIHFVRVLRAAQLRDFTRDERVEYLNRLLPQSTPSP
jgi:hypothetical protein